MRRVRAGHERDTYEQGNETSTAHRNIGHSITSARVAGSAKVETEPEKVRFRPGHLQRRHNGGGCWFKAFHRGP